jgi:hypothetical protein
MTFSFNNSAAPSGNNMVAVYFGGARCNAVGSMVVVANAAFAVQHWIVHAISLGLFETRINMATKHL